MNGHRTTCRVAGVPPASQVSAGGTPATRKGFTLVELLVVISIISLLLAIALPSFNTLLTAGGDQQARNLVGAMLSAARGVAVENQSYALLHIQMGTDGKCWMMPMYRSGNQFVADIGYPPQAVPAGMAFGKVTGDYVNSSGNFQSQSSGATPDTDFTTINVVFGPDGSLVTRVPDPNTGALGDPSMLGGSTIDTGIVAFSGDPNTKIWDNIASVNTVGVRTLALFEYKLLKAGADGDPNKRAEYLDDNASFITVNPYSGQLLPTK